MIFKQTVWYPRQRDTLQVSDCFNRQDWRGLRLLGAKFWDAHHQRWCLFPDDFSQEKYDQGILQEHVMTEPIIHKTPVQGGLFDA
jgi:hypothetical protein